MVGNLNARGPRSFKPSGEINVTPLIDVMLVLLLVFMIAAPISTSNIPVDLPSASAKATSPPPRSVSISIRSDLRIYVDDRQVSVAALAPALKQAGATPASIIFLRIDKRVVYGQTLGVLDTLRNAGFVKVALVGLSEG